MKKKTKKMPMPEGLERFRKHTREPYPWGGYRSSATLLRATRDIVVYKAVDLTRGYTTPDGRWYKSHGGIAKLLIRKGTVISCRSGLLYGDWGGKARAESAQVISIFTKKNKVQRKTAMSKHDHGFVYKLGCVVKPTSVFRYDNHECASGIHFFFRLRDAMEYE